MGEIDIIRAFLTQEEQNLRLKDSLVYALFLALPDHLLLESFLRH